MNKENNKYSEYNLHICFKDTKHITVIIKLEGIVIQTMDRGRIYLTLGHSTRYYRYSRIQIIPGTQPEKKNDNLNSDGINPNLPDITP